METTREYQRKVYMCLIDYCKAYDCVDQLCYAGCMMIKGQLYEPSSEMQTGLRSTKV